MARSQRGTPSALAQPADAEASATPAPPATLTDLPKGQVLPMVVQRWSAADGDRLHGNQRNHEFKRLAAAA